MYFSPSGPLNLEGPCALHMLHNPLLRHCLAGLRTVRVRKKSCGSGSADIGVRSPHTSATARLGGGAVGAGRARPVRHVAVCEPENK